METLHSSGESESGRYNDDDWLVNEDNPSPVPEFMDGLQKEKEPLFDPEETSLSFYHNNSLTLSKNRGTLSLMNKHPELCGDIDDSVTAIEFLTPVDEHTDENLKKTAIDSGLSEPFADIVASKTDEFDKHLYFVGEIKDFEDVKPFLIDPEGAAERDGDKKFAVSYSGDEIYDILPIIDVVPHPVKDKGALYAAYEKITGQRLITEAGK